MRLSASHLDAFRLYQQADFLSLEELGKRLRYEDDSEPSEAMLQGRAFDAIVDMLVMRNMDHAQRLHEVYVHDNYTFDGVSVEQFVAPIPPGGVTQVKAVVDIDGIKVVGKVDYLVGRCVEEYKLTQKAIQMDRYHESWQWRVYMEAFGVDVVQYRIGQAMKDRRTGVIGLRDIAAPVMYRYPQLRNELRRFVNELAEFATRHRLFERAA